MTAHFSRYTKDMDSHIAVDDIENLNQIQFQSMISNEVLAKLFQKRNGCNGNQYKIAERR